MQKNVTFLLVSVTSIRLHGMDIFALFPLLSGKLKTRINQLAHSFYSYKCSVITTFMYIMYGSS